MRRSAAKRPGPLNSQKDHCAPTRPKPISSPGAPDVRAHCSALRPFVAWPRDPLTDRAAVGQRRDLAREDRMDRMTRTTNAHEHVQSDLMRLPPEAVGWGG